MIRPLQRYQIVTDVAVAAAFAVVMLLFTWGGVIGVGIPNDRVSAIIAVLLVGPFSAALALRRISPPLALALAWVGAILQMLAQLPPLPVDIAIFAVLYTCAAYGTNRVFWLGFASSIAGALAITVYLLVPTALYSVDAIGGDLAYLLITGTVLIIASVFGLLLAWTVGALVRVGMRARGTAEAQRRAETRARAEFERNRIARDMHDVVAHSLAVVIAQADGARYAAAADPDAAAASLQTISTTARSALSDVRMLLTQLRHSEGEGPQPTVAELEVLYAQVRAAGLDLRVDVDPVPPGEPPAAVQIAVYRILQEALTNAMRHGAGGTVDVSLAWLPDRVEVRVSNPLPPASAIAGGTPSGGYGLVGMRERAQLIGGHLEVGPVGDAFVVAATLPIGGPA
ncbi:sensor histidine kinase [Microbacterium thalli]|uniref:sensor histidine kinase n=1 Tax=Microbacterium thalli TaxID=3027921 RepID=UPI0023658F00|nr:histidine kinase [Microbacterium thalli]MDD7927951.1 histidine kinase [Microbacterium thalli]